MDRLRAAHPALEIESCSGGGGRIDFRGAAAHPPRVDQRLHRRAVAHRHPARLPAVLPARDHGRAHRHRAVAQHRPQPGHGAFAARWRCPATWAWSWTCGTWTTPHARELQGWIALYKQWRDHACTTAAPGWATRSDHVRWQLHGEPGRQRLAAAGLPHRSPARCATCGQGAPADAGPRAARYRLRVVTPDGLPEAALFDGTRALLRRHAHRRGCGGRTAPGCANAGLPLPRAKAETAFIVRLQGAMNDDASPSTPPSTRTGAATR